MHKEKKVLFVDAGNTAVKAMVFHKNQPEIIDRIPSSEKDDVEKAFREWSEIYKTVYVSSVRRDLNKLLEQEGKFRNVVLYTYKNIPEKYIGVTSKETLGMDRFFAAYGAWKLSGERAAIIIDAGTACTVDLIAEDGRYLGGVIMPGLEIMNTSLSSVTSMLPKIEADIPTEWPPQSTNTALQWGICGSYVDAISAHITRHKTKIQDADIFLTGGDSSFLEKYIHVDHIKPQLVFQGLKVFTEKEKQD